MSEPTPNGAPRIASSAASPPLLPPALLSGFQGLLVLPKFWLVLSGTRFSWGVFERQKGSAAARFSKSTSSPSSLSG